MNQPSQSPASRRAMILITGAAVLVAIAALLLFMNARSDARAQQQQSQKLEERLQALESGAGRLPPPGPGGASAPRRGGQDSSLNLMDNAPSPAELEAKRVALENDFNSRATDPGAAARELHMLEALTAPELKDVGIAPTDPDVDCRQGRCRLTASFKSAADASDWIVYYVTIVGGQHVSRSQPAFVQRPDGKTELKLYMDIPSAAP